MTENTNANNTPRPIVAMDMKTMEVVAEYSSVSNAVKTISSLSKCHHALVMAIRERKSLHGYYWDYKNQQDKEQCVYTSDKFTKTPFKKRIVQLNEQGEIVMEYDSIAEAKRAINCDHKTMKRLIAKGVYKVLED